MDNNGTSLGLTKVINSHTFCRYMSCTKSVISLKTVSTALLPNKVSYHF